MDEKRLSRETVAMQPPTLPLSDVLTARERELIEAALAETRGKVSGPSGRLRSSASRRRPWNRESARWGSVRVGTKILIRCGLVGDHKSRRFANSRNVATSASVKLRSFATLAMACPLLQSPR